MARGDFSTSNYLSHTTSVPTAFPITFSCWIKVTGSGANFPALMGITDNTVTNRTLTLSLNRTTSKVQAVNSWSTFQLAESSGTYTNGTWHHVAATFTDNNNRAVFLDGSKNTDTGSSGTGLDSNANQFALGVLYRTTVDDAFAGKMAWPCVWDVVLSDAEITALSNGAHPLRTQPTSIWGFWGDLHSSGNEPAFVGTNLTETGTLPVSGSPLVAFGAPIAVASSLSPDLTTGVEFDGTSDYLTRGADLTGSADGKVGTFAFLLKLDAAIGDGTYQIWHTASDRVSVQYSQNVILGNFIYVRASNASGTEILSIDSVDLSSPAGSWLAILISWDLATGTAQMYIDDVDSVSGTPTTTNDSIDYTQTDHAVGATTAGANKLDGCLGEFYFALEHVDLSTAANRRDFFDTDGNPVDKGSDGATPTGTAPIVYLSGGEAQFANNFGSGGAFTETGTLADCAIPTFPLAAVWRSSLMMLGAGA